MPTMLAARLHEIGKPMQLEQVPIPTPRPTDVVVQVKACNVVPNLKNVLATYAEWFPYLPLPQLPAIFGLDSAGVVTQVGDQVRGIQVGDRVYVNPGLSCGSCRACRRGEDQNCPAYTFMGYFSFGPDGQKLFDAYPYGGLVRVPDRARAEPGPPARLRHLRAGRPLRLPRHRPSPPCAKPAPDPAAPSSSTASPAPSASAPASSPSASASPASSAPAATPTCSTTSRRSHPAASTCCPPEPRTCRTGSGSRPTARVSTSSSTPSDPARRPRRMLEAVDSLARGGVAGRHRRDDGTPGPGPVRDDVLAAQRPGQPLVLHPRGPGHGRHGRLRRPRPLRPRTPHLPARRRSTRRSTPSRSGTADSPTSSACPEK